MSCDKCISAACLMSFNWFPPCLFLAVVSLQPTPHTLHTAHSQSAHHIPAHTHTLSHTNPSTSPFCSTFQHSRSPSPVCQRLPQNIPRAAVLWLHQQSDCGSRAALSPPPTEPTHWSVTTPGGSLAHSANAERKWSDSFVALHLSFFCLKITCRVQIQPVESIWILFFVIFPSS